MPQPIQPPKLPAIIQLKAPKDAASPTKSSRGPVLVSAQPASIGRVVTPAPTEAFPPESSALKVEKSAALLGPAISVGDSPQSPLTVLSESEQDQELERKELESKNGFTPAPSSSPSPTSDSISFRASPIIPGLMPSNSSLPNPGGSNIKRLVTQERGGEVKDYEFSVPTQAQAQPNQQAAPTPNQPQATPQPSTSPAGTIPTTPLGVGGVIELTGDRQEYNEQQKVVTAIGNVVLRFREALLNADRVSVNLPNRLIVAEGNVALTRGQQVLRGNRFEYYFVQDSGVILNASGELYSPTAGTDLTLLTPPNGTATAAPPLQRPISDRITSTEPLQDITSPGGYSFAFGAGRSIANVGTPRNGGTINRYRYQAERVDFDGLGAVATNVRITNDPFSPPELELRAPKVRFTHVEPLVDEVVATRPRIVFDQGPQIPTFRNRITIDRRPREPGLLNFGYDSRDRGGLFVERAFEIINTPAVRFSVSPQYFIQRAVSDGSIIDPSVFGFRSRLTATLSPRTIVTGRAVLPTLDFGDASEKLRASLRVQQIIGTTLPHTLNLEYSYRDRLFNGSLGYQTVRSSVGAVLTSPTIALGKTGIALDYQVGAQYVTADTDRLDLLKPVRDNNRISLGRYQATATLSKGFLLWQGQALPATPTEGLRYTPTPVVPNLQLSTAITGVATAYSSGDSQNSISGSVLLNGTFGHFSRPSLDFTQFNIGYSQDFISGLSPFLFDRDVDTRVLTAGLRQQIYGPFLLGFQTSVNLDTGEEISTDYYLQYSRRTYNILLRYNPALQLGSISLQISDFNWTGEPGLFDGSNVRPVVQGVTRY